MKGKLLRENLEPPGIDAIASKYCISEETLNKDEVILIKIDDTENKET